MEMDDRKNYDLGGSRVALNTTVLCSKNEVSPLPEGSSILHLITLPCCHKSCPVKRNIELVEGLTTGTNSNKGLRELFPLLDTQGTT